PRGHGGPTGAGGRRRRRLAGGAALALLGLAAAPLTSAHAAGVGFAAPTFVDMQRAGGEPGIIHSNKFGDLVYTSHEGDTHIDRAGAGGAGSIVQFLCPNAPTVDCAKNHVWIWTSDNGGASWDRRDEGLSYTGFSDPDLTQDAAGSVYNTGIDLANDSVFSSQDGGKTWPHGTTNCHEGDRPWLGGGQAGEVFMSTDTSTASGHEIYYSNNSADSCSATGIPDNGSFSSGGHSGTYSGFGKMVYDPFDHSIIEPAAFNNSDNSFGVGISRLPNAANAFSGGGETFAPVEVASGTSVYSPFGAPEVISMDSAENIYFAWDTNDRVANTSGGCSTTVPNASGGPNGSPTPALNHIMFVAGKHIGALGSGLGWTFSAPIDLATQNSAHPTGRVLWPWSVAGSDGNVSVVWYQMDQLVDPDCDSINGDGFPPPDPNSGAVPDVNTFVYEAHISNATDPAARQIAGPINASGRAIHQGGICDSGTTCVATGQDRRLGDYFTNSVDPNGCVIIASGDTTVPDVTGQPRITSLPVFIKQNSGPSLTTGQDCAILGTAVSEAPWTSALILLGALGLGAAMLARRRNRRFLRT
ncbi:MAG: hypothetical protein ACRDRD_21195, partial [Pseudonocardiaceae bacterium]